MASAQSVKAMRSRRLAVLGLPGPSFFGDTFLELTFDLKVRTLIFRRWQLSNSLAAIRGRIWHELIHPARRIGERFACWVLATVLFGWGKIYDI